MIRMRTKERECVCVCGTLLQTWLVFLLFAEWGLTCQLIASANVTSFITILHRTREHRLHSDGSSVHPSSGPQCGLLSRISNTSLPLNSGTNWRSLADPWSGLPSYFSKPETPLKNQLGSSSLSLCQWSFQKWVVSIEFWTAFKLKIQIYSIYLILAGAAGSCAPAAFIPS